VTTSFVAHAMCCILLYIEIQVIFLGMGRTVKGIKGDGRGGSNCISGVLVGLEQGLQHRM